ncbi:MAG TPA: alpha-isopropylmalate synthase regulatory domain-containing protein [Bacteroidales bacterium]|nr:alpha-isopropylmalate synthase regulatory domain-containing protein [Bacteroidales bacterium]
MATRIEIMDTTLRDGEQTTGVSYTEAEKLNIAKALLEEVKVDRIEVASARVSEGEYKGMSTITRWAAKAGHLHKIEVLGFVDGGQSLQWIKDAGGQVINLLTKGSLKHCQEQLRKTPDEHIADIKACVLKAQQMGIVVNMYLEDWSNGMRNSPEYVFHMVDALQNLPIRRFMLPDTLGILNPDETYKFCRQMIERYPQLHFDFHAHNDYDLAAGNVYMAVKAGVKGVHTTVNGLGERAGNVPLASVVAILKDHLHCELSVEEVTLNKISRLVESFSGIRIPANKPIVGEYVYTQVAGIHADGDSKNKLYYNDLFPERFGRQRKYALGKLSGKANIKQNLEQMGIELTAEEMKKVTDRIIELGDKKEFVTPEDLPYIIADVLQGERVSEMIRIKNYALSVANNLRSVATLKLEVNQQEYEETAAGDGQYDAFMKALQKIYQKLGKKLPELIDYMVTIPPGGRTDALVETTITWKDDIREFKTRGLDPDQNVAAIKATLRMLNVIEKNGDR